MFSDKHAYLARGSAVDAVVAVPAQDGVVHDGAALAAGAAATIGVVITPGKEGEI